MRKGNDDRLEGLLRECDGHLLEGALEDALSAATRAAELAPRSATAHRLQAEALLALGREDEAAGAFERALSIDGDDLLALWGLAELLVGGSEDPEALDQAILLCKRGLNLARKARDKEAEGEFLFIEARALAAVGDAQQALARLDDAREFLGDDPELRLERGMVLFELCRMDDAALDLEAVLQANPDDAWAHHYLGLVHERRGNEDSAEARFAKARTLAPEEFPAPVRLTEDEFDRAVEAALEELPEKVRRYLGNVAIAVEPFPPQEEIEGQDLSPTILGVFRGSPFGDKSVFDPWSHFPNSIVLYQRNLERFAASREELIDEIGVTLLHEVGHFLGFDEDDLRERDLH